MEVRSSKHRVQFLLALTSPGICSKSKIVFSSSSAGTGGVESLGAFSKISDIGTPSIEASDDFSFLKTCFPFEDASRVFDSLVRDLLQSRITENNL